MSSIHLEKDASNAMKAAILAMMTQIYVASARKATFLMKNTNAKSVQNIAIVAILRHALVVMKNFMPMEVHVSHAQKFVKHAQAQQLTIACIVILDFILQAMAYATNVMILAQNAMALLHHLVMDALKVTFGMSKDTSAQNVNSIVQIAQI